MGRAQAVEARLNAAAPRPPEQASHRHVRRRDRIAYDGTFARGASGARPGFCESSVTGVVLPRVIAVHQASALQPFDGTRLVGIAALDSIGRRPIGKLLHWCRGGATTTGCGPLRAKQ